MSKRNENRKPVETPTPEVETPTPAEQPTASVQLVVLSDKGKAHQFRPGSQRDVWYTSLRAYEGKPLADWLTAVAAEVPMQRQKPDHKSSHKGGGGFLRRFAREGLLAWRSE